MPHRFAPRAATLAMLLLLPAIAAADGRIYTNNGVALDGTDPVAYFEAGEPVQGSPDHSHEWHGVEWHFANARHRHRRNPHATP